MSAAQSLTKPGLLDGAGAAIPFEHPVSYMVGVGVGIAVGVGVEVGIGVAVGVGVAVGIGVVVGVGVGAAVGVGVAGVRVAVGIGGAVGARVAGGVAVGVAAGVGAGVEVGAGSAQATINARQTATSALSAARDLAGIPLLNCNFVLCVGNAASHPGKQRTLLDCVLYRTAALSGKGVISAYAGMTVRGRQG